MNELFLTQISITIDNTIEAYENLLNLYEEKKEALVKKEHEALTVIDKKILNIADTIRTLTKDKQSILNENNYDDITITQLIALAKEQNNQELVEKFKKNKVTIGEVNQRIALLDKTIVELIKHGLVMSDKLLNIILSATMPQKDNYDMHGKNVDHSSLSISSIVENA